MEKTAQAPLSFQLWLRLFLCEAGVGQIFVWGAFRGLQNALEQALPFLRQAVKSGNDVTAFQRPRRCFHKTFLWGVAKASAVFSLQSEQREARAASFPPCRPQFLPQEKAADSVSAEPTTFFFVLNCRPIPTGLPRWYRSSRPTAFAVQRLTLYSRLSCSSSHSRRRTRRLRRR